MTIKVFFVHGLEGRPGGTKHAWLAQELGNENVRCIAMPMRKLQRPWGNPMLLMGLLMASVAFWLLIQAIRRAMAYQVISCCEYVATALFCYFLSRTFIHKAVQYALVACARQQAEELRAFDPDIVVGSSWGGAVAVEMAKQQWWRGPMLLLAPAPVRVAVMATGIPHIPTITNKTLIIHGTKDKSVPFADSVALKKKNENVHLIPREGCGHSLCAKGDKGAMESPNELVQYVFDAMELQFL